MKEKTAACWSERCYIYIYNRIYISRELEKDLICLLKITESPRNHNQSVTTSPSTHKQLVTCPTTINLLSRRRCAGGRSMQRSPRTRTNGTACHALPLPPDRPAKIWDKNDQFGPTSSILVSKTAPHPATINRERTKNTETAHNDVESSQRIEGELPEPTGGEKTARNLTRNRPINAD